jgi:APA family basic amino acid/polyamine antiporter
VSKNVDDILHEANPAEAGFKRTLSAFELMLLGVGAIVGAGNFTTIGTAAAGNAARPGAGPSLILSFVITAVVCSFTALCYAELAAMVPISGSAYTYAYAALGELTAWIIGWDLILEYAISNVAIAISWSSYACSLLEGVGLHVPLWLATDYRTAQSMPEVLAAAPRVLGMPIIFNAPAIGIVVALTLLVMWGIRESTRFNTFIVFFKLAVLAFFVGMAAWVCTGPKLVANMQPFFPNGMHGTLAGAAIAFFAYVGFDSVSTVAEETRDPGRDVPRGIIGSLLVCTVVYLAVAVAFCGLLPYGVLVAQPASVQAEPLNLALDYVVPNASFIGPVIAFGAVVAQTAAILVYQIAQPRIFYVMARDGLLPPVFAAMHPVWRTPWVTTLVTGAVVAAMAGFASFDEMVDLTNIGTLFAFSLVCLGVPILRLSNPHRTRPFKVPFGPFVVPALGVFTCVGLMVYLPPASWWRFVGWLVVGLSIYAFFGYANSVMGRKLGRSPVVTVAQKLVGLAFAIMALGLFTLPHEASLWTVLTLLGRAAQEGLTHDPMVGRAALGSGLVAASALALMGMGFRERGRRSPYGPPGH